MKIFELMWAEYEGRQSYLYTHKDRTTTQFKQDVNNLLVKHGKAYLDSEESWAGIDNWIDFISDKLPELGYERVSPNTVGFFGGYIIGRSEERDMSLWEKEVGTELFNAAVEHNKRLQQSFEEE